MLIRSLTGWPAHELSATDSAVRPVLLIVKYASTLASLLREVAREARRRELLTTLVALKPKHDGINPVEDFVFPQSPFGDSPL